MQRRYQNSMIVAVKNFIFLEISILFICFYIELALMDAEGPITRLGPSLTVILTFLALFCCWYIVRHTDYVFDDNRLTVTRKFIAVRTSEIQYSRMSSVGLTRSIFDRLVGTSTLFFNVNSKVNATKADQTLCIDQYEAVQLRDFLNAKIFGYGQQEARGAGGLGYAPEGVPQGAPAYAPPRENLIKITNLDVVIHSFIGQPSPQLVVALATLVYGIWSAVVEYLEGLWFSVFFFLFWEIIPVVAVICQYYNYRIYRVGDTVTAEYGMFTQRSFSFKENKVNSVRIRAPLLARLFGLCTLEAEVVGGANQNDNNNLPVLCPLKKREKVMKLLDDALPGFAIKKEMSPQPKAGKRICELYWSLGALISAGIGVALWWACNEYDYGDLAVPMLVIFLIIAAGTAAYGFMAADKRAFAEDGNVFAFVTGGFDLSETRFNYDKVQIAELRAGPRERRRGVCRCTVRMLSSKGFAKVESGRFSEEDLRTVPDTVMARIRDGRYDWRRYE